MINSYNNLTEPKGVFYNCFLSLTATSQWSKQVALPIFLTLKHQKMFGIHYVKHIVSQRINCPFSTDG